jgi:hypothetical protein
MLGRVIHRYLAGGQASPMASSGLPAGSPGGKGVGVDPDLPGVSTFNKPTEDTSTSETPSGDESIHRVDSPRDMGKSQTTPDEISNPNSTPSGFGLGQPDTGVKPQYPYRDNKSDSRTAWVVQAWLAEQAPRVVVQAGLRTAKRIAELFSGLDPKVQQRARKALVTLSRADLKNLRWIFSVKGNGTYVVKLKAIRPKPTVVDFQKMDLELSCSCPYWQWQGPEYHGTTDEFNLGKPRGTASTPDIRDPERNHHVCKHVAAVLSQVRGWTAPVGKAPAKPSAKPVAKKPAKKPAVKLPKK